MDPETSTLSEHSSPGRATADGRRGEALQRGRWRSFGWASFAVCAAMLPVLPGLTGSRVFYVRDLSLFFWGRYLWLRRAWLSGDWPMWDPHVGAGQSAVADALHQMFLLPAVLMRVIGSEVFGFNLWVAAPFPLAGLGAYAFFARRFSRQSSALGAIAFAASGPIVSTGNFPNMSWAVAALPWVLWAVDRAASRPSARRVAVLALTVALQAFAGEPVTQFATLVVAGAYGPLVAIQDPGVGQRMRHALAVATGICLGLGLAAIQLVPMAQAAAASDRSAGIPQEVWSLRPTALVEAVWPHLFGDYFTSQALRELPWMPLMFTGRDPFFFSIYLGVPLLALAACGLGGPASRRWRLFWVATGGVGLVSAFGAYTPIQPFLRDHLPLLGAFRFPVKYLVVSVMAVSAGVAAAWDTIAAPGSGDADRRRIVRGRMIAIGFALAVGILAAGLCAACLLFPAFASGRLQQYAMLLGDADGVAAARFMLLAIPRGASWLVLLSLATSGLLVLGWSASRLAPAGRSLLYLLVVADLIVRACGVNPVFDRTHLTQPEWLSSTRTDPDARFYVGGKRDGTLDSFDPDGSRAFLNPPGLAGSASRAALGNQAAFYPSAWHAREMLSYDLAVLWPRRFAKVTERFLMAELTDRDRFLDRTGVRYRVLPQRRAGGRTPLVKIPYFLESFLYDWGPDVAPRLSMVASARVVAPDQQIEALFKPGWDTRAVVLVERDARTAGDPGPALAPSARFVIDDANRAVVEATAGTSGGYLVLLDSYSEDWRAMVDGRPAELVRANGLFRAVRIASGRHTVEFAYHPRALFVGAGISAVVLAVLVVLLTGRRQRRVQPNLYSQTQDCRSAQADPGLRRAAVAPSTADFWPIRGRSTQPASSAGGSGLDPANRPSEPRMAIGCACVRREDSAVEPTDGEGAMGMRKGMGRQASSAAGYSLIEMLVVMGLIAVVSGASVMMMPGAILSASANSGADRVVSVLRVAREQAIAQRRNIRMQFNAPNLIVVSRVEVPGPGVTVISSVLLENGMTFRLVPGIPDTPDAFGNATATSFGMATTLAFTSEGSFVDQNGDPANGTVFMSKADQPLSARAVSLYGPTALIHAWRWNGAQWTQ